MRSAALLLLVLLVAGCSARRDCAQGDYGGSECRELTAWDLADRAEGGYLLRFQEPLEPSREGLAPVGMFLGEEGATVARQGTLGPFQISIDAEQASEPRDLELELRNVDPRLRIIASQEVWPMQEVSFVAEEGSLQRSATLPLEPGEPWTIRATLTCPERYRLAMVGDIQHGVDIFEQVAAALWTERAAAAEADEPLMGLVIVGDLSDEALLEEFEELHRILAEAPVPTVATPGNHDVTFDEPDLYTWQFGSGNLDFDLCGGRVVVLDTADGALAPTVETRLDRMLATPEEEALVVGTHLPPFSDRFGNGWTHEDQQSRLLAELALAGADLVVAGHVHNLVEEVAVPVGDRTIHQVIAGTAGGGQGMLAPRYGFLRVTVDGDAVERCFVQVGDDDPEPRRDDEPPMCP